MPISHCVVAESDTTERPKHTHTHTLLNWEGILGFSSSKYAHVATESVAVYKIQFAANHLAPRPPCPEAFICASLVAQLVKNPPAKQET